MMHRTVNLKFKMHAVILSSYNIDYIFILMLGYFQVLLLNCHLLRIAYLGVATDLQIQRVHHQS
jgi:hypothetical protein